MATTTLVKGARASRSTITLKLLMAASGIIFIGFVLLHMYGNLKAFSGHDAYNEYAEHLRTLGEPMLPREGLLWIIRVGADRVAGRARRLRRPRCGSAPSRRARTQYVMKKNNASSLSSRTMRWGGLTLLLFIIWHLLKFTIGKVNVSAAGATNDPYNLLVDTFDTWWMTLIYLVAMLTLGDAPAPRRVELRADPRPHQQRPRPPQREEPRLDRRHRHRRRLLARPDLRPRRRHHQVEGVSRT